MTMRHHGGGHKQKLRLIDFKRDKFGVPGKVATIEYDPNRSSRIALMHYADGEKRYILQPDGLKVGPDGDERSGGRHPDRQRAAAQEHSGRHHGAQRRAAAGQGRADGALGGRRRRSWWRRKATTRCLKLPSGETRRVLVECMATVGQVGNTDHENVSIGKAGRNRWKGMRPTNRGVSMNPVDHPHGGGEGKTSGGRHPVTPWGQPTRGYKTRNNKRTDKFIVSRRSEVERDRDMARSTKKGPFIDTHLMVKIEAMNAGQ